MLSVNVILLTRYCRTIGEKNNFFSKISDQ